MQAIELDARRTKGSVSHAAGGRHVNRDSTRFKVRVWRRSPIQASIRTDVPKVDSRPLDRRSVERLDGSVRPVQYSAQMAPTVVRDGKFRMFFFSREEARIHVHVEHPDGEAKFWLRPQIALATYSFRRANLREAQSVVEAHLTEIQNAWNDHFGS